MPPSYLAPGWKSWLEVVGILATRSGSHWPMDSMKYADSNRIFNPGRSILSHRPENRFLICRRRTNAVAEKPVMAPRISDCAGEQKFVSWSDVQAALRGG